MAVKKAVVYVPTSNFSNVNNEINKALSQIPPYEDAGVNYRSKYKVQKDQSTWELKNQNVRMYHERTPGGSAGFIPRLNYKSCTFYLKQIIVTWMMQGVPMRDYIRLYDGYTIILGGIKQLEFSVNYGTNTIIIDLPVPIKFSQSEIGYDIWSGATPGDWCDLTLIGWEELI